MNKEQRFNFIMFLIVIFLTITTTLLVISKQYSEKRLECQKNEAVFVEAHNGSFCISKSMIKEIE